MSAAAVTGSNETSTDNTTTSANVIALQMAKNEYPSIWEALAGNSTTVLVSIGVVILIVVIFTFARVWIAYLQASDAKVLAEREAAKEKEENLRLKEELKAARLDKEQLAMVKANSSDVEDLVPAHLKLSWRLLKFLKVSRWRPLHDQA